MSALSQDAEPVASSPGDLTPSVEDLHWLRGQLQRMNEESQSLAQQVVQGLEEVALLRWVAERLELPEYSSDVAELTPSILAELQSLVEAESLLLAPCDEKAAALDYSATTFTCQGAPLLSDDELREWLLLERGFARERPLIRNHVASETYRGRFPQLREFVLLEIRNKGRLAGWLAAFNRSQRRAERTAFGWEGFTTVEATLMSTVAFMLAAHFHNLELVRQRESLLTNLVRALVNAIDARDPYMCGHSERVALFARRLGKEIGLNAAECERLYLSGLLHDVGKIGLPDEVSGKPGKLTEAEFKILSQHPEAGWRILHELDALKQVLPGVLHHHERIDGGGYPDGLAGDAIPLDGRILAICDAYDAMTSDRPYREGMAQEQVEAILCDGAGSQWDAELVATFLQIMPEVLAIRRANRPRAGGARRNEAD